MNTWILASTEKPKDGTEVKVARDGWMEARRAVKMGHQWVYAVFCADGWETVEVDIEDSDFWIDITKISKKAKD